MIDSAARESAILSSGSVLVQAPAGSGKTTLLTQRLLRLLSLIDAPERILALTFTRRAAQEMRERVLAALEAAGGAERPRGMDPLTWSLAVAAAQRMQSLGVDLVSQPARLRIETIDAFNAWLQSQLPVAAGAGAGRRVLEHPRASYQEAARRALAYDDADIFGAAVEHVLQLDDQRWNGLVKLIAEMLPSRERWLPLLAGRLHTGRELDPAQLRELRRHFDEDLQLLIARKLAHARTVLGEERLATLAVLLRGAALRLLEEPRMAPWRDTPGELRTDADDAPRWRSAANLLLTANGHVRKHTTATMGFPSGCADKPAFKDLLLELARDPDAEDALRELRDLPDPAYDDSQWGSVRDVAQFLVLAAAQLNLVFRERATMDFPAMSMAALRALGSAAAPTDLNLRLDYRLEHILIDEFQDTSGAQLDLLRLLTAGWQRDDGRSLFCVGDPMQSIYGFRQAEVRAFLDLAEQGIGDVRFDVQRLQVNFRSTRSLTSWTNLAFATIMPATDDRARGAIAFRPSEALLEAAADEQPAVRTLLFGSREQEAYAVADMLEDTVRLHPEWRMAVLVRARSHAREIASCLRARSVRYRAANIEPLQDRSIVRDILMLTRALTHRGDRIAWLAVLRGPWVGLSLADLLPIARGPLVWDAIRNADRLEQLSRDGQMRCTRLAETLDAAFRSQQSVPTSRWIENTWLRLGGPASAASPEDLELAATAFARLRALDVEGMPDAADFQQGFADLFAAHEAPCSVEIMTIHKAKGLEFDLVIVPALDRTVPSAKDQLLLLHEFARAGRDGMLMAARPAVGEERDALFDFLQRQAKDSAALEAQRLLYVACTRAKRQLRLTAVGAESTEFRPRAGSLLAQLWPSCGSTFMLANPATRAPIDLSSDGAPRGGPLIRLPLAWFASAPARVPAEVPAAMAVAVSPGIDDVALEEPDAWPVFDWAGETARRVGMLVHAELRSFHPDRTDPQAIRAKEPLFKRWLEACGVPSDRLPRAVSRVVEALLAVQADVRARWIFASGYRDDLREYAVSGVWNGAIVRAVFDRTFVDGGTRWVIDYKTSQHLGGAAGEFLDREVDRYRPQLQRYARLAQKLGPEPVRVGLYFPLMRAWREWDPEIPRLSPTD